MNEISKPQAVSPPKPVVASVSVATQAIKGDVPAPAVQPDTTSPHQAEVDIQEIQAHVEAAVAQMNAYIQSNQRDLHFSYDRASGETVVKVLDRQTQEVIRQIPDAVFLKIAEQKDSDGHLSLFSAQA